MAIEKNEKTMQEMSPSIKPTRACVSCDGAFLHIPGNFWPLDNNWWMGEKYEQSLRLLARKELEEKVIFIGKVVGRIGRKY